MKRKIANILNFFVLFVIAVALTGVNVCRFYCTPCGHEYILVNTFPDAGKCYCDACRYADSGKEIHGCCGKAQTEACCSCHSGYKKCSHDHTDCDHAFYKITDIFQAESVLDIDFVAVLFDNVGYQIPYFDTCLTFIPDCRNFDSSKAPPLEWLCTYLC